MFKVMSSDQGHLRPDIPPSVESTQASQEAATAKSKDIIAQLHERITTHLEEYIPNCRVEQDEEGGIEIHPIHEISFLQIGSDGDNTIKAETTIARKTVPQIAELISSSLSGDSPPLSATEHLTNHRKAIALLNIGAANLYGFIDTPDYERGSSFGRKGITKEVATAIVLGAADKVQRSIEETVETVVAERVEEEVQQEVAKLEREKEMLDGKIKERQTATAELTEALDKATKDLNESKNEHDRLDQAFTKVGDYLLNTLTEQTERGKPGIDGLSETKLPEVKKKGFLSLGKGFEIPEQPPAFNDIDSFIQGKLQIDNSTAESLRVLGVNDRWCSQALIGMAKATVPKAEGTSGYAIKVSTQGELLNNIIELARIIDPTLSIQIEGQKEAILGAITDSPEKTRPYLEDYAARVITLYLLKHGDDIPGEVHGTQRVYPPLMQPILNGNTEGFTQAFESLQKVEAAKERVETNDSKFKAIQTQVIETQGTLERFEAERDRAEEKAIQIQTAGSKYERGRKMRQELREPFLTPANPNLTEIQNNDHMLQENVMQSKLLEQAVRAIEAGTPNCLSAENRGKVLAENQYLLRTVSDRQQASSTEYLPDHLIPLVEAMLPEGYVGDKDVAANMVADIMRANSDQGYVLSRSGYVKNNNEARRNTMFGIAAEVVAGARVIDLKQAVEGQLTYYYSVENNKRQPLSWELQVSRNNPEAIQEVYNTVMDQVFRRFPEGADAHFLPSQLVANDISNYGPFKMSQIAEKADTDPSVQLSVLYRMGLINGSPLGSKRTYAIEVPPLQHYDKPI